MIVHKYGEANEMVEFTKDNSSSTLYIEDGQRYPWWW